MLCVSGDVVHFLRLDVGDVWKMDALPVSLAGAFAHLGEFRLKVLELHVGGRSVPDIAVLLGESTTRVRSCVHSPAFRHALAEVETVMRVREAFTVEHAHDIFMGALVEADSPSDQIAAGRELVKLHRLDRLDRPRTVVVEGVEVLDVESMSDEELKRMALEAPVDVDGP